MLLGSLICDVQLRILLLGGMWEPFGQDPSRPGGGTWWLAKLVTHGPGSQEWMWAAGPADVHHP